MAETQFVNGLRVFLPRAQAPSYVKADIVIKVSELSAWLSEYGKDEVRLQIKESKEGKLYAAVNDFQPTARQSVPPPPPAQRPVPPPFQSRPTPPPPPMETEIDDIPFDVARTAQPTRYVPTSDEVYPNRSRGSNYCGD